MQFDKQLGALKQKLDSRVIQDILPYYAYPLVCQMVERCGNADGEILPLTISN